MNPSNQDSPFETSESFAGNEALDQRIEGSALEHRLLAATAKVANALLTIAPFDQAVNTALQILGRSLETDRAKVLECCFDDPSKSYPTHYTMSYEWIRADSIPQISHSDLSHISIFGAEALKEKLYQNDSFGDRLHEWTESLWNAPEAVQAKAIYCVPIRVEGKLWGVLVFDNCYEVKHQNLAELAVLKVAANCIGSAIQRDRTQQAVLKAEQERTAELAKANEALARASERLAEQPDLSAFLSHLMFEAMAQVGADGGHLTLYDKQRDVISMAVLIEDGMIVQLPSFPPEMPVAEVGFIQLIRETRKLRYFDLESNFKQDAHLLWTEVGAHHKQHKHLAGIAIPLYAGNEFLGHLGLAFNHQKPISEQGTELLQALAHQASLAIQLTRLAEEAKEAAITREQEKAALERAAELKKANDVLRRSARNIVKNSGINDILPLCLREAIAVSGASAGAILRRVGDSEFEFVAILQGTDLLCGERLQEHSFYKAVKQVSREDPTGWFRRLASGETLWRLTDDNQAGPIPECDDYHRPHQQRSVWDIPYKIGDRVAGYLGLAFQGDEGPSQIVTETVTTLATQVGLTLELAELAEAAKQEAIAREQEKAAQKQAAELAQANDALRRSVGHLTTTDNLYSFMVAALQEAAQASCAAAGAIFVYDAPSHALQINALVLDGEVVDLASDPRAEIWRSPVPAGCSPAWQIIQQRQIAWLNVNQPQSEAWQFAAAWHQQLGHKTIPMIPLAIGDRVLGFLGLAFTTEQQPSEFRFEQCHTFAHHAALALQMADLMQQAKQSAILEERNRMAREIHDTLAQSFTSIGMQLEAATRFLTRSPEQVQACLSFAQELAHAGLAEARRSVWALQTEAEDYCQLATTLQRLAARRSAESFIQVEVAIVGTSHPLSAEVGMNLLRIGQEALNNAMHHAQAQIILLTLTYTPDHIQLQVQDDGQGFDPQLQLNSGGFGLMGMQQRSDRLGGALMITSQLGQGTEVRITVPCQKEN